MKSIIKKINSVPLFKNTAKLVSANILMSLIPLVCTPIISRIYEPSSFADWGVFSSLFTMTYVVLHLCYEHVIVRCNKDEVGNVTILNIFVSICIILLMLIAFLLGGYLNLKFFVEFPQKTFFFTYLVITAFLVIAQQIANREGRYTLMSIGSITIGLSQATLRILFGVVIIFSNGLIAGTVFAQLVALFVFIILLYNYFNRYFFSNISLKGIAEVAQKYKKFPLFDAPATLMAFAASNTPIIILSLYFNKPEIGCYSMIVHLLLMPISFIGSSMGKVYYQHISQACNDDVKKISAVSLKVIKTTTLISVLPTLFLVLGGDKLTALFLGSQWSIADKMILCLAIWSIPTIITEPLRFIYRYKSKQNILFKFNIFYFLGGLISLIICCSLGLSIFTTITIYAVTTATVKTCLFFNVLKQTNVLLTQVGTLNKILLTTSIILLAIRLCFILF